jgi:hypothetical protein
MCIQAMGERRTLREMHNTIPQNVRRTTAQNAGPFTAEGPQ